MTPEYTNSVHLTFPEATLNDWQDIVNATAKLLDVPAALIMRIIDTEIEVLVTSESTANPYTQGSREYLPGSGLYCETVINSNQPLLVENALTNPEWKNNPDIALDMISYLGYPILLPDGRAFGTICVLDCKENAYTKQYRQLLKSFRNVIQSQLEITYMNAVLGDKNKTLNEYLKEIKIFRGIIPICSYCNSIRENNGNWVKVEHYITERSDAKFSHGICTQCIEEYHPNLD